MCGWVITRTWTIRAVYEECTEGVPRGGAMSTSRDQLIIISDVTPPIFIIVEAANKPMDWVNGSVLPHDWAKHPKGLNTSMSVRVPFFRNFRKWSSIPSVEDRATSNIFQAMGLVSSVRMCALLMWIVEIRLICVMVVVSARNLFLLVSKGSGCDARNQREQQFKPN